MRETSLEGIQRLLMADFQSNAARSLDLVASEASEPAPRPEPAPTHLVRKVGVGLVLGLVVPVSGVLLLAHVLGGM